MESKQSGRGLENYFYFYLCFYFLNKGLFHIVHLYDMTKPRASNKIIKENVV